jgi:hypothetical protein
MLKSSVFTELCGSGGSKKLEKAWSGLRGEKGWKTTGDGRSSSRYGKNSKLLRLGGTELASNNEGASAGFGRSEYEEFCKLPMPVWPEGDTTSVGSWFSQKLSGFPSYRGSLDQSANNTPAATTTPRP